MCISSISNAFFIWGRLIACVENTAPILYICECSIAWIQSTYLECTRTFKTHLLGLSRQTMKWKKIFSVNFVWKIMLDHRSMHHSIFPIYNVRTLMEICIYNTLYNAQWISLSTCTYLLITSYKWLLTTF